MSRGELGKVYLVHGHYLQDWLYYETDYNWRLETTLSGVSRAIADIGSHWCDLAQFITGQRITSVFADLMTVHPKRKRPKGAIETFKGKEVAVSGDVEGRSPREAERGHYQRSFASPSGGT
jgi:predicted dehydrogenase